MNVTGVTQTVLAPDEVEFYERAKEITDELPAWGWVSYAKIMLGQLTHRFHHTWVRHMRYDPNSDRLVDVGLICLFCSRAKRG